MLSLWVRHGEEVHAGRVKERACRVKERTSSVKERASRVKERACWPCVNGDVHVELHDSHHDDSHLMM
jgi:hypothetical protein